MRMLRHFPVVLSSIVLLSAPLVLADSNGPATQPSDDVRKIVDASAPVAKHVSARDQILQQYRKYLAEKGLQEGANNPGHAFIAWSSETVSVPGNDAAWGKARVLAYEAALADAEAKFVQFEKQRIESERVRKLFDNDSEISAEFEKDRAQEKEKWQVVQDKALALTEAELNAKLRQAGIDPATLEGRKPFEKVVILHDSISKDATITAFGSLAGVRTLQTFEGLDDTGKDSIGVLIVSTPTFADLANTISNGRAVHTASKQPGAPIMDQIPKDEGGLLCDFGIRVLVDENGDQCIVSFGQWSVGNNALSDRGQEIMLDRATETARISARAAIADFANATLTLQDNSKVSGVLEDYKRKHSDIDIEAVPAAAEITDVLDESSKMKSDLVISGVADIYTWHTKDPQYGHDIVGVVCMWSPATQEQAATLRDRTARPASGGAVTPAQPGVRQGHDLDNPSNW